MNYLISHVPNSQKTLNYKIKSAEGDKEAAFSFCKELYMVWGKPSEQKLGQVMIAYVKKNGWSKSPVILDEKTSGRNLNTYVSALLGAKKEK